MDSKMTGSNNMENMEEVKKVFNRFDVNRDGKIDPTELGNAVRSALNSDISDEEVQAMLQEMDSNRDGCVDLGEFAEFQRSGRGDEELKEAFGLYDVNKNGLISDKELHMVMLKLGEACTIEDCRRMITSVDSDKDGFVNFQEFKKMMGCEGGGSAVGDLANAAARNH